jgi:hypothetical protein
VHIVPKGILHLAALRAHGYTLGLEEHIHLTKHIMDEPTKRIIAKLDQQVAQKEMDACSECALDNHKFDYIINNDGSLDELYEQVNNVINNKLK